MLETAVYPAQNLPLETRLNTLWLYIDNIKKLHETISHCEAKYPNPFYFDRQPHFTESKSFIIIIIIYFIITIIQHH